MIFLFVQGKAANAYLLTPTTSSKVSIPEAQNLMGKSRVDGGQLNLPLEGIRISKILLESPRGGGTFQLQTRDLIQRIDGWSSLAQPIAVQVFWAHAEAVIVFPGHDAQAHPVIFIRDGLIATELDALSTITSWNEPTCAISILPQHEATDAWTEYRLHLAFSKIAELVITHYNEMVGRSLVSVLNQDIYDETLKKGWRISCIGNGILDHHIFSSPADAADAYRTLLGLILAHMQTVVGPGITYSIIEEAISALDKESQEIIRSYRLLAPTVAGKIGGTEDAQ